MATLVTNAILPLGSNLGFGGGIEVYGGCTLPSGITVAGNSCFEQVTVVSGISVSNLSVGNVFPMMSNRIENNLPVVGFVTPLFFTYPTSLGPTTTTALPEGQWFVYFVVRENGVSVEEDPYAIMTKIWSIPAGKYLRFLSDGSTKLSNNPPVSGYTSGIFYQIGDTGGSSDLQSTLGATAPSAGSISNVRNWFSQNGWTEFVVGTNASSEYWNDTIEHETGSGVFIIGSNSLIADGHGFAVKIG